MEDIYIGEQLRLMNLSLKKMAEKDVSQSEEVVKQLTELKEKLSVVEEKFDVGWKGSAAVLQQHKDWLEKHDEMIRDFVDVFRFYGENVATLDQQMQYLMKKDNDNA